MTNVGLKSNPELYKKGQEFLKNDGKIDQNELNQLNKIAAKNGSTNEEKEYIKSLSNQKKVTTIKSGKSESVQTIFPDKKSDYDTLLSTVSDKSTFEQLYKSGKLNQKDSNGKTILENLKEMSSSKMKGTIDGKKLADETIAMLADRGKITQGAHGTCGAGAAQNLLWNEDPAEMIRIVKEIAQNGKVTLRDKSVMKAGTNTDTWHNGNAMKDGSIEKRTDFDIIFQSSLMRSQSFLSEYTDYNVQNDLGDGKSVLTGDSASDPYKVKNMLQSITGNHYDTNMFDFEKAKERVNEGKQVVAGYFTSDKDWGMHYVTILSIKDGVVTFQNTGNSSSTVDTMSEKEFKDKMFTVISRNDSKTGKPESEDGFISKATDGIPFVIAATALVSPRLALVTAPPLLGIYVVKKTKDLITEIPKIPEKIKQAAIDANNDVKKNEWFKDEKGDAKTAKQYIKTVEKETEERVLKTTGNKNAAKVSSKVAGGMQTAVSTLAVGGVMISNKVKKTGAALDKFGRSANGLAHVTNVKANANLEAAKTKDGMEKVKYKAIGYGLKVVSKASKVVGKVSQGTGKVVSYVGAKIEQGTGAVVKVAKPVITAVSNTVGRVYSGVSSAYNTVSSGISSVGSSIKNSSYMPWNW